MVRAVQFSLVSETITKDSIGQEVKTESTRSVYGNKSSISRAEWRAGGEMGLKPSMMISMFSYDYNDEKIAIVDSERYSIYRTYLTETDAIELYLEKRVGDE